MRGQYQWEENMLRKIMIVVIAIAVIGAMAIPTDVSARGRGGYHGSYRGGNYSGYRGGYYSGYRGGYGYRSFGYPYYYSGAYASCWRLRYTPWGPRRVWVCGGAYPYY